MIPLNTPDVKIVDPVVLELTEEEEMLALDFEISRLVLENVQLRNRLIRHMREENDIGETSNSPMNNSTVNNSPSRFPELSDGDNDNVVDYGVESNVLFELKEQPSPMSSDLQGDNDNRFDYGEENGVLSDLEKEPEPTSDSQAVHRCDMCELKFVYRWQLHKHIQDCGAYFCEICDTIFYTKESLDNHMVERHKVDGGKRFECHFCGKKCIRVANLNKHKCVIGDSSKRTKYY